MKLTTRSEYALLAVVHIAREQDRGPVSIESIHKHYRISRKYLEHLVQTLKKGGILKAKRGPGGGYRLARDPDSISMAEIIRLMDGPLAPTEAVSTHFFSPTPLEAENEILQVFREVRNMISNHLENIFIGDFCKSENHIHERGPGNGN